MRRLKGLLATAVLLAIVIGLPVVLVAIGANPIPGSVPSADQIGDALTRPDDGTLALSVLAAVVWLAWAFLTVAIALEVAAQLRGMSAPRLPGLSLPQSLARGMVGTAALLFLAAAPVAQSSSITPPAHAAAFTAPAAVPVHADAHAPSATDATDERAGHKAGQGQQEGPRTVEHTVAAGESLWSIAEQHLGAGQRYTELTDLNRDLLGDRPGFIQPGTVLRLPAPTDSHTERHPASDYTVQPGDSLSKIAADQLGDQAAWPKLYEKNRETVGEDPDLIYPGQVLDLPRTAPQQPGDQPEQQAPEQDQVPEIQPEAQPDAQPEQQPEQQPEEQPEEQPGQQGAPPAGQTNEAPPQTSPQASPTESPAPEAPATGGAPADDEEAEGAGEAVDHGDGGLDFSLLRAAVATGFVGAGVFAMVALNRRRQFRERRPGRTIAATPPELVAVEREVVSGGKPQVDVAEFVEATIRGLTVQVGAAGLQMPPVGAVTLDEVELRLLFTAEVGGDAPGEWSAAADGMSWALARSATVPQVTGDAAFPYPTLVTVGTTTAAGDVPERTWMLDLESLGVVGIAGEPTLVGDAARWLITEMAVNRWAWGVDVVLGGDFAPELTGLTKPDPRGASVRCVDDVDQITTQATMTAERNREAMAYWDKDVLEMRRTGGGEHLSPLVVVVPVDAPNRLVDAATTVDGSRSRVVLIQGDRRADAQIVVNADGTALLPRWGVTVRLHVVSREVVSAMADLVIATADRADQPMPPAGESAPLTKLTDVAGALRVEYTNPRVTGPGDSVLPEPDEVYVEAGATTAEDLQMLAPAVPDEVAAEVLAADPDLDADMADWYDADNRRPRVRLLGPPQVEAWGGETDRLPSVTETIVYLASQDKRSATTQQATAAFGIQAASVHNRASAARAFLGQNPDGEDWLPESSLSPASRKRGMTVYQLHEQVLVDADLFRRLRARGMARGRAGMKDLVAALRLVDGEPFSQLPRGYGWLADNPVHIYLTEGVVDVASEIGNAALAGGDIETARWACRIAICASPASEDPRLLLAAVEEAAGSGLAAKVLREQVHDVVLADDLIPENPTARSQAVINGRKWRTG